MAGPLLREGLQWSCLLSRSLYVTFVEHIYHISRKPAKLSEGSDVTASIAVPCTPNQRSAKFLEDPDNLINNFMQMKLQQVRSHVFGQKNANCRKKTKEN